MSKTRDTGNITNVIKVDATGNVSFVSGSTTLATISTSGQMSGSLPALSSSYALSASYVTNAETLDGLDSTVFTLTSSFNTTSASLYTVSSSAYATSGSLSATSGSLSATSGSLSATSGSLSAASGSLNTRVTALEVTGSALSSSILSVSASSYSTSGSLSSASGSFDTRISTVESKYATTGSNTFIGTQIISGSILQSGSFTSTGTLTAQTLVVQTITSSVVYSSGSNIFGNSLGNSQVFTGSVLITGSLTLTGPMIGSSTACFSGTLCANYLYSATSVVANTTLFTGADIRKLSNNQCIFFKNAAGDNEMTIGGTGNVGIGTTSPAYLLDVNGTGRFSGNLLANSGMTLNGGSMVIQSSSITRGYFGDVDGDTNIQVRAENAFSIKTGGNNTRLTIASTGAATFSSNIQVGGSAITGNSSAFYNTTTETSVAIKQTSGATYLALGLWNNDTTADSRFLRFFTEATATYRGAIQYDRPGNRLAIYGGGCGLVFDGAATFTSDDNSGNRTTLNDVLTITQTNGNAPYSGFGSGILFKGTTYNGGGAGIPATRSWGKIGMQVTDSSFATTGENMIFQVAAADNSDTLTTALTLAYNSAATFSSGIATLGYTASTSYAALFNGSVGIGTNAPPVGLSIQGTTSDSVTIQLKQNAAGGRDYRITSRDDGSLRINDDTAGSERMRITSCGNVGIGVTSASTAAGIVELALGGAASNPLISGIRDGANAFYIYSDSGGTDFGEKRNLYLRFITNNTERVRIACNGVVRMGTCAINTNANSNVALQVAGAIRFGNPDGDYVTSYGGGISARALSLSPGSATIIIKGLGGSGFLYQVQGFTGTGKRFTDLVMGINTILSVVHSVTEATPATRSYTITSENLNLCLSGADTYNIVSHGFGAVER